MSSWKQVRFSEICDITRGGSPRPIQEYMTNDGVPWIKISDATASNSRFIEKTKEFIKTSGISKSREVFPDDLILSNSATPGIPKFMRIYACIHDGWLLLRNFNGAEKEFIYWLLLNERDKLIQQGNGSVFTNLKTDILKNHIVNIPDDIEEQKRIATILNNIQEKIELNTQINQTLEQIAQTIFKSWFIDFDPVHAKAEALANGQTAEQATQAAMAVISGKNTQELHRLQTANPEQYQQLWEIAEAFPSGFDEEGVPRGWEQTTLSEVCSMKNGYAFKSSDWTEEGIPVIKIGSVKPMIVEVDGNGFVDEEHSVLHSEFLLTEGDIVVGLTGYVGEVGRIPQGRTAMLNQRVAKFIPNKLNEQQDYYSFVYCLVRDKSFKAFAETNAKGSAQANISTKELLNYSIILASSEIQMKFESLIKPLLDKILVNSGNNENLSKVRDLLLPKLLRGELNGLPEKTI
ncbi:restriction endonuclease subunit S [Glaesserella parasuis]|uniref:restriction endonuclease subunit S n=1 Tax=Glaesserella parasuis TaxID=738 RepID=UPI002436CD26|nr:restriction endonuclease subunit S [Glaesserella parasuis]MDG6365969.1 restriction endonuclease subunit S [Glaesserella parasuis]MDG6372300.1 restriction endonuclease subunit S [Glaesserella parasuis]MDG6444249.1 restriction endonuclease subunit S [Glaesserella parasuis]MDO9733308.1 restriction endonuclease subunit S [Glaesserella parasuis]